MAEHVTAKDALAAWDRGEIITTVEMGGLGPGYEQALQILVFEIIRADGDHEVAIKRASPGVGGFSDAQVGAARALAGRAIEKGWAATLAEVDPDRRVMVDRRFPQPPEAP